MSHSRSAVRPPTGDDSDVIERVAEAAGLMGISPATFWRKAKTDPDFPPLIRLGPKMIGIRRGDRRLYVRLLLADAEADGEDDA